MSTRYVYGIYDTTGHSLYQKSEPETLTAISEYPYVGAILCESYRSSVAYNRQGKPVTKFVPYGDYFQCAGVNFSGSGSGGTPYVADTAKYKHIIFYKGTKTLESDDIILSDCYLLELVKESGAFWHTYTNNRNKSITVWNDNNSANTSSATDPMPFVKSGGIIGKGNTLYGYESSNQKNLSEGAIASGSYSWEWREYIGYDNIDPVAVSYSKNDLYPGEPVTITVTPRDPAYGETVYYRYQYSLDGGSTWTSIGRRTTETSTTVTIPDGATQFQASVNADDGLGYVSSSPVYGPAKEVSQLKAYVGIGGKAAALKKGYFGVGGKAMQLVKGYVGVGGVAKKLF